MRGLLLVIVVCFGCYLLLLSLFVCLFVCFFVAVFVSCCLPLLLLRWPFVLEFVVVVACGSLSLSWASPWGAVGALVEVLAGVLPLPNPPSHQPPYPACGALWIFSLFFGFSGLPSKTNSHESYVR